MIKIEADDVTISGLTFQNAGDAQAAIMAATVYDIDNVNITDNTFLSDAGNAAVLTWSGDATTFDNWTVERNFIDHMSGWPGAIELTNATNSMVKDNKIITDNIGVLMTSQYGADLMDNTITGNEITVLDPAPDVWDNGILIYSGVATPTPGNRAENILIENNTIYSEGNGIATWDGTGDGLFGIEVTNNTFGAIESNDIGTDVNYYSNHFKIGGANGITTIQEAVDLALEGDVLEIPDGIYNENLVIDKALFLEGSETADTIIAGTGSGTGLKIEADNIFINNLIVDNFHYGIHIDTDVSNLALDSVIVKNNTHGLMVSNTASLNFATIANSEFRGNNIGIYFAKEFSSPDDSTVSWLFMSGVTLENNVVKGMYAEKLENTWMEDLTVFNNGTSAAAWPPNNGIDINLKNGDYENIVITDSYFEQNGFYNGGDDLSGQLAIKARGTGLDSSYAAYPATLKNVAVFNNTFVRDPANAAQETHAIRLGEPGKLNTEPTEVYIYDNTFIGYDEDDKIVDVRDISVIDDSYLPPWLKSKNDSKKEVAGTYYGDYLTYLEKEEEKNNEYYKKIMNLAGKYNASDFTETASDRKVFHNKKLTMADLSVLQAYLLNGKISNNVEAIQALLEN
jgi:nitrous oxidase accessory protein NosD